MLESSRRSEWRWRLKKCFPIFLGTSHAEVDAADCSACLNDGSFKHDMKTGKGCKENQMVCSLILVETTCPSESVGKHDLGPQAASKVNVLQSSESFDFRIAQGRFKSINWHLHVNHLQNVFFRMDACILINTCLRVVFVRSCHTCFIKRHHRKLLRIDYRDTKTFQVKFFQPISVEVAVRQTNAI